MSRLTHVALVLAALYTPAAAQRSVNLVSNPSFEEGDEGLPADWRWSPLKAKGECTLDDQVKRSGEFSVKLTNATPREPHVYSYLATTVSLLPGRTYTLSCYVKSDDAGVAWIGGGQKWRVRMPFPRNAPDWTRVSKTFEATSEESRFQLMILSESPTAGLWVDDVQVELGNEATEFKLAPSLKPGEAVFELGAAALGENLLPNSSFEQVDGNRPKHWMWDRRNTDAELTIDDTLFRSGTRSLKLTSTTPFGAHVYGALTLVGGVAVEPSTTYTLSYYMRGDAGGCGFVGGATGWRARARFVRSPDAWTRVTYTFTTNDDEKSIPFLVILERPCKGVWLDDLKLEAGPRAMPYVFEGDTAKPEIELALLQPASVTYRGRSFVPAWAPSRYPPESVVFAGRALWAEGFVFTPEATPGARVSVAVRDEAGAALGTREETRDLPAGATALDFGWSPGDSRSRRVTLVGTVRDADGQTVAECSGDFELISTASAEAKLAELEGTNERLRALLDGGRAKDDYLRVAHTVLTNFLDYARDDLRHDEVARAWDAAVEMEVLAKDALDNDRSRLHAPRYLTSPLTLDGPCVLGKARLPDGTIEENRPLYQIGYGHFSSVRRDIEKFPEYGLNLIQIEFGPRSVLPAEGEVSDAAIDSFLGVADRCAKSNVSVNLLVSPHYFPDWALEKWPHLRDCSGGFLRYCVHAPESRSILEQFLRRVIPRIKDHPALHSICLSNEPVSTDLTKCLYTRENWHNWLTREHGTVARLNERWQTEYDAFADVPVPEAKFDQSPLVYDFVRFNQEQFAGFHRWMADVVHSMAPDLPVHAKIMMSAHWGRGAHGIWSVDPEQFGELSQCNGNDCCKWYARDGEWAAQWLGENMAYDFQLSTADKPVFNSENHLIIDRDLDVIPPEFVRNVFWQGAIHGQSATTTWVWERTFDPVASAAGSIMHRPRCAAEVGRTCLDLNRLAHEVAALQRLKPQVVLLYSLASILNGDAHDLALKRTYEALNFCGVKLGFVTERQLTRFAETGELPVSMKEAKALVLPSVTHTTDACVAAVSQLKDRGITVVEVGEPFAQLSEYGGKRPLGFRSTIRLDLPDTARELWDALRSQLLGWGVTPEVELVDESGNAVWGVEWLSAEVDGRLVVNLSNYLREPVSVRMRAAGQTADATNLVTQEGLGETFPVPSLAPMLLQCR